jgi:hypothetical protein
MALLAIVSVLINFIDRLPLHTLRQQEVGVAILGRKNIFSFGFMYS